MTDARYKFKARAFFLPKSFIPKPAIKVASRFLPTVHCEGVLGSTLSSILVVPVSRSHQAVLATSRQRSLNSISHAAHTLQKASLRSN